MSGKLRGKVYGIAGKAGKMMR